MLEILDHLDKSELPGDYVAMAIRFSGRRIFRQRTYPAGMNHMTVDRFRTSFYGSPLLRVPSVIVPREFNFVLLPEADGFDATIGWIEPLCFDSRLFVS